MCALWTKIVSQDSIWAKFEPARSFSIYKLVIAP